MGTDKENPGSQLQDHRGDNSDDDKPSASTIDARLTKNETGTGVNGDEARRHREFMERHVEELKENLKKAKASLNAHKLHQKTKPSEDRAKKIAELEAEVIRLEAELRNAEEHLKDLEPEEIPDEEQPWFKKVYANCTGYLIEDEEGNFKVYNDTAASRELRGMGISDRRDTHTTSPLDRALNRIRKRYQVDHYGPIAGYRPGIIK
jgi:chromosome segregation ATPase